MNAKNLIFIVILFAMLLGFLLASGWLQVFMGICMFAAALLMFICRGLRTINRKEG